MSDLVELALRSGAATTFLVLSLILLRDGGDRTVARLGALFAASAAVRILCAEPFCDWLMNGGRPLMALSFGGAAALWLFARAMFDDGFRMRPWDWAALLGLIALGAAWGYSRELHQPPYVFRIPFQTMEVLFGLATIWIAWRGRGNDLVEPRRRARLVFVTLTGAFLAVITASFLAPGQSAPVVTDIHVAGTFAVAVGLALAVVGVRDRESLGGRPPSAVRVFGNPSAASIACVDPGEARLLAKLTRMMEEERVYRHESLSIGSLAARLGSPEYLLRRLINQRLGFRNFSAYINSWRIAEAKAALADPAQTDVPISTIALDAGFSSLGPFNRAFRAEVGATPTAFRQRLHEGRAFEDESDLKFG